MKMLRFLPLLFLAACSTAPKLALRPQPPSPPLDNSTVRYPEVLHAYHFGRYVDPGDDLVMHEQHTVFRVEENTRWNFHPGISGSAINLPAPTNAALNPLPVNDAILAEVNSQRLATAQIMREAGTLSAAMGQFQNALQQARTNWQQTAELNASVTDMQKRLEALEVAQGQSPTISSTNKSSDALSP